MARSASEAAYARAQQTLRRVLTRVVAVHHTGRTPELVCPRGQSLAAVAARHGYGSPQHVDLVGIAVDELLLGGLALELLTAMLEHAQRETELEAERRRAPQSQRPTAPPPAGWPDGETTVERAADFERRLTGDLAQLLDEPPRPSPLPRDALTRRLRRRP